MSAALMEPLSSSAGSTSSFGASSVHGSTAPPARFPLPGIRAAGNICTCLGPTPQHQLDQRPGRAKPR